MKKIQCNICGEEFDKVQLKANHIRWKHTDNTEFLKKQSSLSKSSNEKRHGKWVSETINCYKCNNITEIKYREGKKKSKYYCSRKCANSRKFSYESQQKRSNTIKQLWANGFYNNTTALNHLSQPKQFSSKNERLIVNYFKTNFPNDKWTSGGNIKHNNTRLTRDMYSNKLKICFEYDGVWHFVNINNQLESKQHKDKVLEDWCLEHNYRLIRIDEDVFTSCKQIEDLIYNTTEQIIKIGNRY